MYTVNNHSNIVAVNTTATLTQTALKLNQSLFTVGSGAINYVDYSYVSEVDYQAGCLTTVPASNGGALSNWFVQHLAALGVPTSANTCKLYTHQTFALNVTTPFLAASQIEGFISQLNVTKGDLRWDDRQAASWTTAVLDGTSLSVTGHILLTLDQTHSATVYPPAYTPNTRMQLLCNPTAMPFAYWNLTSPTAPLSNTRVTYDGASCDTILYALDDALPAALDLQGLMNVNVTLASDNVGSSYYRRIDIQELTSSISINDTALTQLDWLECLACPVRFRVRDNFNEFVLEEQKVNRTVLAIVQVDSPARADVRSPNGGTISLQASAVRFEPDGRYLKEEGRNQGISYCLDPNLQCTDNYWADVVVIGSYPCMTPEEKSRCEEKQQAYLDTSLPITCDESEEADSWVLHINPVHGDADVEYTVGWYSLYAVYYFSVFAIAAVAMVKPSIAFMCWVPCVVAALMLKTNTENNAWDDNARELVDTANKVVTKLSYIGWYCGIKTDDIDLLYTIWLAAAGWVIAIHSLRFFVMHSKFQLPRWKPMHFIRNRLGRDRTYGKLDQASSASSLDEFEGGSGWTAASLGGLFTKFCHFCLLSVMFLLMIPVLYHIDGPLDRTQEFFVFLFIILIAVLFCVDRANSLHGKASTYDEFDSSSFGVESDSDAEPTEKEKEADGADGIDSAEEDYGSGGGVPGLSLTSLFMRGWRIFSMSLLVLPIFVLAVLARPNTDNHLSDTGYTATAIGLVFVQQLTQLLYHYQLIHRAFGKKRTVLMIILAVTSVGLNFVGMCVGLLFIASLSYWSPGNDSLGLWAAWMATSAFTSGVVLFIQLRPDTWCDCCCKGRKSEGGSTFEMKRRNKKRSKKDTSISAPYGFVDRTSQMNLTKGVEPLLNPNNSINY